MADPRQYLMTWLQQFEAFDQGVSHRLILPYQTPTLNEWQRTHFRQKKKIVEDMAWQFRAQWTPTKPIAKAFVVVERYCRGPHPDWDNLVGGIKPALDALVVSSKKNPMGIGLIQDDGPACLPLQPIVVPQHVSGQAHYRTAVTVIELIERGGA